MCAECLLCVLVVGVDYYYNDDFACGIFYFMRRCASATSTGDDGEVNSWAASAVYIMRKTFTPFFH